MMRRGVGRSDEGGWLRGGIVVVWRKERCNA
jgi:hypothetical protein